MGPAKYFSKNLRSTKGPGKNLSKVSTYMANLIRQIKKIS